MKPQDIQNLLRRNSPHYRFNPRIALAFFLSAFSMLLALANAEKNSTQSGASFNCRFPFLCNDTYYLVIMNALICSNITEVIQQISESGFNGSLTGEPIVKIFYQLINHTHDVNLFRDISKLPQTITENGLMELFLNISNNYFSRIDSTASNITVGVILGCYGALALFAVGIGIYHHHQNNQAQPVAPAVEAIEPAPGNQPAPAEHHDTDPEQGLEMRRIS